MTVEKERGERLKLLKSDSAKQIGAKLYNAGYGIGLLSDLCGFRHGHQLLAGWLDTLRTDETSAQYYAMPAPLAQALSVWIVDRGMDFEVLEL